MSDLMLEQYEEYLEDFRAWGHKFLGKPLTYEQFEDLKVEAESIDIDEECVGLTKKQMERREQIERLLLTHESYFVDGPRITVTWKEE